VLRGGAGDKRPAARAVESGPCRGQRDRPTNHAARSYPASQRKHPLIEKAFGWMKQTGGMRKTRFRGLARVAWAAGVVRDGNNKRKNSRTCGWMYNRPDQGCKMQIPDRVL